MSSAHPPVGMPHHDDPVGLATLVAATSRPMLIGLDVDGVLAPIVAHADDSRLLDGVAETLAALSGTDQVTIAAVSGRSLASLRTFGLPPTVLLVGGHGMERDGRATPPLAPEEVARFTALRSMADDAARQAGPGAWVEVKSASLALHVREADDVRGAAALATLAVRAADVGGAHVKPGSEVLELFARGASKGDAMRELIAETQAATAVFVGDDVTDEEAFEALGENDVSIKVGDAESIAPHRLAGPGAVLEWLRTLTGELTSR